ncbi:Collagen alpha-5(VI) chain [Geodia barretti]|uniref:Collagen alpha-5(VI) chain n=1 Tax=Geodia barretti TaxID=519541 RepID=A0AA35QU66_GEOBA|nr:Collagen alpha-5(VI) chain [Geodia barretti]
MSLLRSGVSLSIVLLLSVYFSICFGENSSSRRGEEEVVVVVEEDGGDTTSSTGSCQLECLRGRDGRDGRDGVRGEKGERGSVGTAGEKGEVGGGEKGEKGQMGDKGALGPNGPPGMKGSKGEAGGTGNRGSEGPTGLRGQKVYGVGYQSSPAGVSGQSIPCTVCYSSLRPTVVMIPAKLTCPPHWTSEYTGYLMTSSGRRSRHECVDQSPESLSGTAAYQFYPLNVGCNGAELTCPPYSSTGNALTCAVCSR